MQNGNGNGVSDQRILEARNDQRQSKIWWSANDFPSKMMATKSWPSSRCSLSCFSFLMLARMNRRDVVLNKT